MRKQETPCYGLLIVVVFMTSHVIGDVNQQCESADLKTCLQVDPSCSWCEEVEEASVTDRLKRCKTYSENLKSCLNSSGGVSDLINFPVSHLKINKNEPFTVAGADFFDNSSNVGKTIIQMRPQNMTVRLRKNQPFKLNVTFKKVIDFPLDIYYVMDLSNSMNDDLTTLKSLGSKLFDDIKLNVTKNIQLGFGSFVDKIMMPYASTVEKQLKNPCINNEQNSDCAPPFGFRHQLGITGDAERFVKEINSTKISGNIDVPEGSFDALMQIAVCSQIEWRPDSTRVILLTTDASPHLANDGKLAAILEANDMKCHLEKGVNKYLDPDAMLYSKSKTMDYPSLGQLKKAFGENKIHSIYAVTETVFPLYQQIEQVLDDAYVSKLSSDSSNIIPLINQTYSKLKGRLSLNTPVAPAGVSITSSVRCPHDNSNETSSKLQCEGIEIGDEIVFEFVFTAEECPSESKTDKVVLKSSSLQDEVIINIEYLCEFECLRNGSSKSEFCNNFGVLTCGVCKCDQGREGSLCQCNSTVNGTAVEESCIRPGKNTEKIYCENNGVCECGKCERCVPPYIGEYCHCKSTGCPSNTEGVCGGADKGRCNNCDDDKKCECIGRFTFKPSDKTCSCDPDKCIDSSNMNCSGRGDCECETCVCNEPTLYSGTHCETCIDPSCTGIEQTCDGEEIRDCVACRSVRDDCGEDVCPTNARIVFEKVLQFPDCSSCNRLSTSPTCKGCAKHVTKMTIPEQCTSYMPDSNCLLHYQIRWTKNYYFIVYVKRFNSETDCSSVLSIALPVTLSVVCIGIILLIIWKIHQVVRDKWRYEQLQKRRTGSIAMNISSLYKDSKRKSSGYTNELNKPTVDDSCDSLDNVFNEDKL